MSDTTAIEWTATRLPDGREWNEVPERVLTEKGLV